MQLLYTMSAQMKRPIFKHIENRAFLEIISTQGGNRTRTSCDIGF